jgi:hypothetical protein
MGKEYVSMGILERIAAGEEMRSPRALSDVIAERLLADMRQKYKAPLQELLQTLQAVESRADRNAPKVVSDALIRSENVDEEQANAIESAYLLGMLAFANKLLAISVDSRFDDVVYEVIQDDTYRKLLDRIHFEGQTTVEKLASFADREPELVRTQLYRLNDLGIVGWHVNNWNRFYYLTEAGKVLLDIGD